MTFKNWDYYESRILVLITNLLGLNVVFTHFNIKIYYVMVNIIIN